MHDMDVAVPESLQRRSRLFGKLANTLDRVDFRCNLGQHGRRIAGARPDFEHSFAALQIQRLGHQRHDIGLGDGLPGGYGERRILIGEFPQTLRKKRLPRDLSQSAEDRFGPDAARRDLIFDHVLAKLRKITHWSLRSCRTLTRIKAAHLRLFTLSPFGE